MPFERGPNTKQWFELHLGKHEWFGNFDGLRAGSLNPRCKREGSQCYSKSHISNRHDQMGRQVRKMVI